MLVWFYENITYTYIANFCSIAAFLISFWVLLSIRKIRKHFEFKARTPEIVDQLTEFSEELNSYMDDPEKYKKEVLIIYKRLEFTLGSLRRKVKGDIVKTVDLTFSRITRLKNDGPSRWNPLKKTVWSFNDEAWALYSDIQGVLQGLKEAAEDIKWSQP